MDDATFDDTSGCDDTQTAGVFFFERRVCVCVCVCVCVSSLCARVRVCLSVRLIFTRHGG